MNPVIKSAGFALLSATALLFLGCGSKVVVAPNPNPPVTASYVNPTPSQVIVSTVPPTPAPPQETVSISPGPNYTWVPGYYNWVGDHYVWVAGSWVAPPGPSELWIAGHWESTTGGYTWITGHWEYR
jgi:hypothetical protein